MADFLLAYYVLNIEKLTLDQFYVKIIIEA